MANPVLVDVLRGAIVESRHRGAFVVMDADGAVVRSEGDVERPVFPRSAVKAIQALPFVESGAADAFGFGEKQLALACASHSGEPEHVRGAAAMLAASGLDESALECGPHWPSGEDATIALARSGGSPSQLHNNCSGKHAAFLCTCRHMGLAHRGYVDFGHGYQAMIRDVMEAVTGAPHGPNNAAVDGCSIPTYAVPLTALARGFARMATGVGLGPERAGAARRLLAACMAQPFQVSGTGRMDLRLMQAGHRRVFVKVGAEGVYCAAIPELGLGLALKCDDGAGRAAETMIAALLSTLFAAGDDLSAAFAALGRQPVLTRRSAEVGAVRPAGPLA